MILGHNYMEPALFHSVPDSHRRLARAVPPRRRDRSRNASYFAACVSWPRRPSCSTRTRPCCCPRPRVGGCSLAASITAEDVPPTQGPLPRCTGRRAYVNTYAEVKAEADVCCTSGNAAAVVQATRRRHGDLPPRRVPGAQRGPGDRPALRAGPTRGADAGEKARPAPDYRIIGWPGRCEVHEKFTSRTSGPRASSSPMPWCWPTPSAARRSSRRPTSRAAPRR